MSRTTSKVRKKYVIQHCPKPNVWVDISCKYNGTYLPDFGCCIGNKSKPSKKIMEKIMQEVNDFASNNYRVVERTIVFIDSK